MTGRRRGFPTSPHGPLRPACGAIPAFRTRSGDGVLRPVSGRGPVRRCGGWPGNNHSKKIRKMTLTYIIRETLLMMGFTFVVGVAFAYVLKLMTLFFSYLNGEDLPSLVRRSRIWGRAYRMEVAHSYRYIRSFVGDERSVREMPMDPATEEESIHGMNGLTEYHFGNPETPERGYANR